MRAVALELSSNDSVDEQLNQWSTNQIPFFGWRIIKKSDEKYIFLSACQLVRSMASKDNGSG